LGQPSHTGLDRCLGLALGAWAAASLAFLVVNGALLLAKGPAVYEALVQVGPVSGLKLTYAAVGLTWLASGLLLALLRRAGYRSRHGLLTVCCFVTLVLYANVLRERSEYPDTGDYMRAAFELAEGRPMHERYIYPPLVAATLELAVPLGRGGMRLGLWVANVLAVAAFPALLALALARYGFERRLAAALALAFVAVNVPVLRTLVYGQVNLHVANLILLALLLYPRRPAGSALALALAVHLKSSPIVLVLPFLAGRSRRFLLAFAASLIGVAAAIFAAHGPQPFLDFQRNASGVYAWSDLSFRDNSIESFLRSSAAVLGGPFVALARAPLGPIVKAALLALALAVAVLSVRRGAFVPPRAPASDVLNGWPALLVLMVLASPLVWEHHPVFVALPFLVIVKRLDTPGEWAAFCSAYGVVFLLPTFDFYPWSFGRLAGLLVLLVLLQRSSSRGRDGELFRAVQERLRPGGAEAPEPAPAATARTVRRDEAE
jgi:hypothetical protein